MFSEVDISHGLASLKITWAAIQKRVSHIRCKIANKCLNVSKRVEIEARNKIVLLSFLFSRFVSACERKPKMKKKMGIICDDFSVFIQRNWMK